MRIKSFLTITLTLAALLSVALPVGAQPINNVSLVPTPQTVNVGAQVSVDLVWNFSLEPTLGGGVDIAYDDTLLSYVSYTPSGVGDASFARNPDPSLGLLSGIAAGDFNGIGGPVVIGTLVFDTMNAGVTNLTPGTTSSVAGPFVSNVTFMEYTGALNFAGAEITIVGVCGDSFPDPGEECDDGNTSNGDGCDSSCQIEPGFDCTAALPGNPPTPSVCTVICPGTSDRYEDQGDGTVLDCNTNLIWLKNANCFGLLAWDDAEAAAAGLNSGECGLIDGSPEGDWRQPTIGEFCSRDAPTPTGGICPVANAPDSLIDSSAGPPTVAAGHPFVVVQSGSYWSATGDDAIFAWGGILNTGFVFFGNKASSYYVWPVREALPDFCGDGTVNPGEECDGGDCCAADCTYLPASAECRMAAGVCDLAESCTGASADCPADGKDSTTVCRPGSGDPNGSGFVCDPDESCDGVNDDCPGDSVAGAGTECNAGSGDPNNSGFVCDPAEVCSGVALEPCPTDSFSDNNTVCNEGSGDPTNSGFICDPDELCPGKADQACPLDFVEMSGTLCRADAGECDVADRCTGVADEGCPADLKNPCALVTDSSLCQFDVDPAACGNTEDQFRLLFTPDVRNWEAYKHNASNPGQYYYNLVTEDLDGAAHITVPYPFVTQGAQPIHVYCAEDVPQDADACFLPAEAEASFAFAITIEDYIAGTMDPSRLMLDCEAGGICGPDGEGFCTFRLDLTGIDLSGCSTGQAYVNVHLDWGLKGPMVDANPCDDGLVDRYDRGSPSGAYFDADVNTIDETGPTAISNCRTFEFSHADYIESFSDAVQNVNAFKPIAGVMGTAMSSLTGGGVVGADVALVKNSNGEIVKTAVTDEDGFYSLAYRHRGKKAPYTVFLLSDDMAQGITLKGNGWGEVTFDTYTRTSTAEYGTGEGDGGGGGGLCDNDGLCEVGEDCTSCVNDCAGRTNGPPSGRFCCGNGVAERAEGNGDICDGNF